MKIEKIDIGDLRPHPRNSRAHPEIEIQKLEKSIKKFGWTSPILVSADGYVLAGHARLEAAKRIGLKEVPGIRLDLKDAKAEAYMMADNRIQEDSQWDLETLEEVMRDIKEPEMLLATGFEEEEIDNLLKMFDDDYTRPEAEDALEGLEIEETPAENILKTDEEASLRVGTWENKKGAYETGNWLCIEYYGQDIRYNMLKEILEAKGAMITGHEIDADFLFSLVMGEGDTN